MEYDPNEQPNQSVGKFESMLKTDDVYFFDAEDFEEIIHHYLNNGKISLAKKAIRMGLQQHPDSLELRLLDVEVLVFENQFDRAETLLDQLQQIDPQNEEIFIQRANIRSKQDNHPAAIELLRQALALSEDDVDIYSLLGMEYLFLDDYNQAQACFMKCLEADPEDYASLYNVVYCYEFLEDYEGAISYLNTYLDANPYCQVGWHQLGKQYYSIKMFAEALTSFDFAIISDETFNEFRSLADQTVRAPAPAGAHFPRHGKHFTSLLRGHGCRDQRAALFRGFHDHDAKREAADQAISGREIESQRPCAHR